MVLAALKAILFIDACNYSRAVRYDEVATLCAVNGHLHSAKLMIEAAGGEVVSLLGDGLYAIFGSAQCAVDCALQIQALVSERNHPHSAEYRIGIHLGDTYRIDGQVTGDAVNVAARIEGACDPGGVMVSKTIRDSIQGRRDLKFELKGTPYLKNLGRSIEIFSVYRREEVGGTGKFALCLAGHPTLRAPDGEVKNLQDEAIALLAVLAVFHHRQGCSRSWLQDVLWETEPPDLRSKCLDATLKAVKTDFDDNDDVIANIGSESLRLNTDIVDVDIIDGSDPSLQVVKPRSELLDGFAYGGARFQHWLYAERSLQRSAICLNHPKEHPLSSDGAEIQQESSHLISLLRSYVVGVLPPQSKANCSKSNFVGDMIADLMCRSLSETEVIEVFDYRPTITPAPILRVDNPIPGPDLFLQTRVAAADDLLQISITALRPEDRKVIWSQNVVANHNDFMGLSCSSVNKFVSFTTDALLTALAAGRHMRNADAHHAAKTAINAIHHLLTMSGHGLEKLEADIATAYEIDPKPIYIAWLAYMTTFHIGERYGVRDAAFEERARELARKALEADSQNGTVLGLVAHVHSYVFREFSVANDLISKALEISPYRAICWDSASLLYSYTGRSSDAIRAAEMARSIGRNSPYRHLFDGACCVASLAHGEFEDAVKYGESVMAVQPNFKTVLRYLAASYGHLGDRERGVPAFERLLKVEPDLSVECIRDRSFPVPTKFTGKLLVSGLTRIGLQRHI